MNDRQRHFAEEYAKNPNATAAAIAAGYSVRTARSQGNRLLTNADIQQYLRQLQAEARAERIASALEVQEYWTSVLRDDQQKAETRMKAGELLLKAGGEMVQRVEVSADVDVEEENDVIIFLPDNGRPVITDNIIAELYPDADPEKKMNERRKQNV